MQVVHGGRLRIASLLARGKAGIEAFDADEHSLGIFSDTKTGADAVSSRSTSNFPTQGPAWAICPRCGQPILPEGLSLPPIKRRILDAVQRHPGISGEDLREVVWRADPNGGPEDRKVLHVHVFQLNHRLAAYGVMVRARKGAGAGYRVRLLSPRSRGPPRSKKETRRG
jgi:hypothetical protein